MTYKQISKEFSVIIDKMLSFDDNKCSQEEKDLKQYIKLVLSIARHYVRGKVELEDLCQSGVIGLLEARKTFDPSRSTNFKGYASVKIMGEIFKYCQKNERLVHVQAQVAKSAMYIEKIRKYLGENPGKMDPGEEENITLHYYSKYSRKLPMVIQEKIQYAKDRLKSIAGNSHMSYEDMALMAAASFVVMVPDSHIETE
jgi:RNA polymerase sigma factor (sigma-70 family)